MSRMPFRRLAATPALLLAMLAAPGFDAHAFDPQAGSAPSRGAELLVGN